MDKEQVADILRKSGSCSNSRARTRSRPAPTPMPRARSKGSHEPLEKLVAENRLGEIKGIGEALQKKITELVTTGKLAYYEELKASHPARPVRRCSTFPASAPRRSKRFTTSSASPPSKQLEAGLQRRQGRRARRASAKKPQANICEGITSPPHLRGAPSAQQRACSWPNRLLDNLRQHPDVIRCSTAGSLRRCKEIIGDIDFLVSSKKPGGRHRFLHQPARHLAASARKATPRRASFCRAAFKRTCAW